MWINYPSHAQCLRFVLTCGVMTSCFAKASIFLPSFYIFAARVSQCTLPKRIACVTIPPPFLAHTTCASKIRMFDHEDYSPTTYILLPPVLSKVICAGALMLDLPESLPG